MVEPIIHGLSNEQYHNGEEERQYLSSSILKKYKISPKAYKRYIDNPIEENSDALRFGSLFHNLMESYAVHYDDEFAAIRHWEQSMAIFEPPVNKSTNKLYGATSNPYKEAYAAFLQVNDGKIIASRNEANLAYDMAYSLLRDSSATSEQVRKALRYGKPEVSHFVEYEGCKFKFRPDLTTIYQCKGRRCADLYDWKSVATDDLSEESINRIILKYDYHISASHYQFFFHEQTGIWPDFILVLVSKVAPYDCVMVNMCNYGYRYYPDVDIVSMGPGAMEFKKLLDLHIKCTKESYWPGAEQAIPDNNGVRILEIQPPRYYQSKFIEEI